MAKNEKDNNTIKYIIFSIIILILIGLNLAVFINQHTDKKVATNDTSNGFDPKNYVREVADENTVEKSMQNNISQMGERNRCQTYIGEFLSWIEEGNYDKAYNVLNSDFRTNYFPSVDEFKEYVGGLYDAETDEETIIGLVMNKYGQIMAVNFDMMILIDNHLIILLQ